MYNRLKILLDKMRLIRDRYRLLMLYETNQDIIDIMDALHCMINKYYFTYNRSELIGKYSRILETTYTIREGMDHDESYALLQKVYYDLQE